MANTKKSTLVIADPESYSKFLEQIKADILQTQLRAALSITKELIMFYWRTGKILSTKAKDAGWGASTLKRLAMDLKIEFPDMTGFSLRNLQYMRHFAESYPEANCAAAAAQIPWGHIILVFLDRLIASDLNRVQKSLSFQKIFKNFTKRA